MLDFSLDRNKIPKVLSRLQNKSIKPTDCCIIFISYYKIDVGSKLDKWVEDLFMILND